MTTDPGQPLPQSGTPPDRHLLVVEDDGEMRHLIGRFLRENGFRVTPARDGRELWEALGREPIDLILLDIQLPGTSGLDLCKAVRAKHSTPIIMLTARGDEMDRVVGLELGADDYIPKPFSRSELLARIRAVLRRSSLRSDAASPVQAQRLEFDGWILDISRRELRAPDGSEVDLSGAEFDLLLALAERSQRILTRDQILELSRHRIGDPSDRAVDVLVSRLRRKIEIDRSGSAMVKTVRGAGYMFVPKVTRS
ncbi:MAG: response regulator transcription factor [Alphaproteobacteria bacterium]|nr:response regulator transcription factor [Alphaproteobacteria bacterium]